MGDILDHHIPLTLDETSVSSMIILENPIYLTGSSVSLPQARWSRPHPPNLQTPLTPNLSHHRLLKLGLRSCSQAGSGGLSPWSEDLCDWNSSLCTWLSGGSQTEGIRHVDLKCYYIIHIILILEHSSPCIHSFRPLISPAVREKYFSGRD